MAGELLRTTLTCKHDDNDMFDVFIDNNVYKMKLVKSKVNSCFVCDLNKKCKFPLDCLLLTVAIAPSTLNISFKLKSHE